MRISIFHSNKSTKPKFLLIIYTADVRCLARCRPWHRMHCKLTSRLYWFPQTIGPIENLVRQPLTKPRAAPHAVTHMITHREPHALTRATPIPLDILRNPRRNLYFLARSQSPFGPSKFDYWHRRSPYIPFAHPLPPNLLLSPPSQHQFKNRHGVRHLLPAHQLGVLLL